MPVPVVLLHDPARRLPQPLVVRVNVLSRGVDVREGNAGPCDVTGRLLVALLVEEVDELGAWRARDLLGKGRGTRDAGRLTLGRGSKVHDARVETPKVIGVCRGGNGHDVLVGEESDGAGNPLADAIHKPLRPHNQNRLDAANADDPERVERAREVELGRKLRAIIPGGENVRVAKEHRGWHFSPRRVPGVRAQRDEQVLCIPGREARSTDNLAVRLRRVPHLPLETPVPEEALRYNAHDARGRSRRHAGGDADLVARAAPTSPRFPQTAARATTHPLTMHIKVDLSNSTVVILPGEHEATADTLLSHPCGAFFHLALDRDDMIELVGHDPVRCRGELLLMNDWGRVFLALERAARPWLRDAPNRHALGDFSLTADVLRAAHELQSCDASTTVESLTGGLLCDAFALFTLPQGNDAQLAAAWAFELVEDGMCQDTFETMVLECGGNLGVQRLVVAAIAANEYQTSIFDPLEAARVWGSAPGVAAALMAHGCHVEATGDQAMKETASLCHGVASGVVGTVYPHWTTIQMGRALPVLYAALADENATPRALVALAHMVNNTGVVPADLEVAPPAWRARIPDEMFHAVDPWLATNLVLVGLASGIATPVAWIGDGGFEHAIGALGDDVRERLPSAASRAIQALMAPAARPVLHSVLVAALRCLRHTAVLGGPLDVPRDKLITPQAAIVCEVLAPAFCEAGDAHPEAATIGVNMLAVTRNLLDPTAPSDGAIRRKRARCQSE